MRRIKEHNINTAPYWDGVYLDEARKKRQRVDEVRLIQLKRWVKVRATELDRVPYVLDVGCGLGDVLAALRQDFTAIRYQGVDISEEAVLNCKSAHRLVPATKEDPSGVDFRISEADELPFKEFTFDVVWCGETLEHTDSPLECMNELWRVTGDGGLIVTSLPYRRRNTSDEHVWEFEPSDVTSWAELFGELVFMDCFLQDGWHTMFSVIRKSISRDRFTGGPD